MGIASRASEELLPQIGELVVDKYRVVRLLGSGGMGSVLEARHVSLGHSVALKVLHQAASGGDESSVRFFREARATASLESEHVVRIFDLGTTEQGLPFLVMERLSGFDLGDVLLRTGAFSPGFALECVLQAARGVAQAHEAGIVHRDLKPSNLFLTRRADGSPLVKVLDFGISKLENDDDAVRLTHTRTVVGSPLYMSPEQVRDARQVDKRSDVWSLGAILYEFLSGRPAFDGTTLPSVYASIVTDEPAPIDREGVPAELSELVRRCLTKDRQARIGSAEELIHALEALCEILRAPPLSALDLPFPTRDKDADFVPPTAFPGLRPASDTIVDESIRTSATRRRPTPVAMPTLSSGDSVARGRKWQPAWLALALVVAAAGVAGALWWGGTRVEHSAAEAKTHFLTVDTTPPGALVLERGRILGRTPFRLPIRDGDSELHELVFESKGFASHVARIEPLTEDRSLAIALAPLPEPVAKSDTAPGDDPPALAPDGPRGPRDAMPPRKSAARPVKTSQPAASGPEAPTEGEIHLSR